MATWLEILFSFAAGFILLVIEHTFFKEKQMPVQQKNETGQNNQFNITNYAPVVITAKTASPNNVGNKKKSFL